MCVHVCYIIYYTLFKTFLEISTGSSEIPYDNLEETGVQVYGLPNSIPFHSPFLYNQQQLQQILANLDKIVFLKIPMEVSGDIQLSIHNSAIYKLYFALEV